jgi:hypothetical protein
MYRQQVTLEYTPIDAFPLPAPAPSRLLTSPSCMDLRDFCPWNQTRAIYNARRLGYKYM